MKIRFSRPPWGEGGTPRKLDERRRLLHRNHDAAQRLRILAEAHAEAERLRRVDAEETAASGRALDGKVERRGALSRAADAPSVGEELVDALQRDDENCSSLDPPRTGAKMLTANNAAAATRRRSERRSMLPPVDGDPGNPDHAPAKPFQATLPSIPCFERAGKRRREKQIIIGEVTPRRVGGLEAWDAAPCRV
jgi:hypothetical protein